MPKCYFNKVALRLHVKSFIPARRDPSFIMPGIKFSHVIASGRLNWMKKLIKKYP